MKNIDKRAVILRAVERLKTCPFKATALKIELEADLDRNASEERCLEYMLEKLDDLFGTTYNNGIDYDDEDMPTVYNPYRELSFIRFYNDGSVDSECTLTLKLDNPENIFFLEGIIEAWNDLLDEFGNDVDLDGAGMHMALLNTSDASYPSRPADIQYTCFRNFQRSMNLLLPALYFLATPNGESRGLEYRRPSVHCSDAGHGYDKFNAINFGRGAIEFRVFDTCYADPAQVLDNVVVMANCMRYWRPTYKPSGMTKVCQSLTFGNDDDMTVSRFFTSTEHIDVLNLGLSKLKPAYRSIADLKRQRHFSTTKRSFALRERHWQEEAERLWQEYSDRFDWSIPLRRYRYLANMMEDRIAQHINPDTVRDELETEADQYIARYVNEKRERTSYIAERLAEFRERYSRGVATLTESN